MRNTIRMSASGLRHFLAWSIAATSLSMGIAHAEINRAPTISGIAPTSLKVGSWYNFRPVASDPDDARSFQILLTTTGRALHKRILPAALERQQKLLKAFSDKELATLDDFLVRLQRQAQILAEDEGAQKELA